MFEELIKKTGLPREMVEASLEAAIEESLFHCLGMYDCDVDLAGRTAVGVFRVSRDMSLEEALVFNKSVVGEDIVTVRFDFASFPKRVVRECGRLFPRILFDMEGSAKYKAWRAKRRTVTEGVVIDRTGNEVTLDLGSQSGSLGWVNAMKPNKNDTAELRLRGTTSIEERYFVGLLRLTQPTK